LYLSKFLNIPIIYFITRPLQHLSGERIWMKYKTGDEKGKIV